MKDASVDGLLKQSRIFRVLNSINYTLDQPSASFAINARVRSACVLSVGRLI